MGKVAGNLTRRLCKFRCAKSICCRFLHHFTFFRFYIFLSTLVKHTHQNSSPTCKSFRSSNCKLASIFYEQFYVHKLMSLIRRSSVMNRRFPVGHRWSVSNMAVSRALLEEFRIQTIFMRSVWWNPLMAVFNILFLFCYLVLFVNFFVLVSLSKRSIS